jgi:hypothetical protein
MHDTPRFIDDLVHLILECDEDSWWSRDLLRLTLVSSAWVWPVRKRLYACPHVRSFRACTLLTRTLTESPFLLPLVHGIDLHPSGVCSDRMLCEAEMTSLRFILSLDGLTSITLGGDLAVGAEMFLNSLAHPDAVTSLCIDGGLGRGNRCGRTPFLEWDEVLAFKFANLQVLSLSHLELDILPPPTPYHLETTRLILDNVHITSGYLPHLLHESWASLRSLSVIAGSASDFDEHMKLTLACCGSTLHDLHYEVDDTPSNEPLFNTNTPVYPSLRRLYLSGVEIDSSALSIITACCQNLESLSVTGRIVRVTPREWSSFLKSRALPALRDLCTPWGTNYPPFMRWSEDTSKEVLDALASRDIQVSWPQMALCKPS